MIQLDFSKLPQQLLTTVITDASNGQVLMVAYMNEKVGKKL